MVVDNIGYQSLDEIVFESRNQHYGAYRLRKQYQRHAVAGLLIATAFFGLLVSLPTLAKWLGFKGDTIPKVVSKPTVYPAIRPPLIEANKIKPPASSREVKPIERKLLVQPTTAVVEETPPIEDLTNIPGGNPLEGIPSDTEAFPGDLSTNGVLSTKENPGKKEPYIVVEQMPEFPGGSEQMLRYLGKNIRYPTIAQQTNTEGKVFVQFVMDPDGKVTDIVIIKGLSKECDEEAMRVVKAMPTWKPGKQNGMAVPVRFVFPIVFKMNFSY